MNPNIPNSYKNILPSSRFIKTIIIIGIITIVVILLPRTITWFQNFHLSNIQTKSLVINVPSGDPTSRDSDGDGIPDWQEIAVGINPLSPETIAGVPDMVTFEKVKKTVGIDLFNITKANATDTDKVGLALYNDLSQDSIASGTASTHSVSAITSAEVANYITAKHAKNKKYTAADLVITDNTDSNIKKYYDAIVKINTPIFDKNLVSHVSAYIDNKESKAVYIDQKLATIDTFIPKILAIPVPSTAVDIHLAGLNALSGLRETIAAYDPATTDNLSQLGTVGLVEDYIRSAVLANANLMQYFSVTLDMKSSKKK
jgi:hypothetical protein